MIRLSVLILSVPLMVCGAISAAFGEYTLPYELRQVPPMTWAAEYPEATTFASVAVFIAALLFRPKRSVLVNDFKG